jgi:hypothetical protein
LLSKLIYAREHKFLPLLVSHDQFGACSKILPVSTLFVKKAYDFCHNNPVYLCLYKCGRARVLVEKEGIGIRINKKYEWSKKSRGKKKKKILHFILQANSFLV